MTVRVEAVGDAVVVTLDRPRTKNAIDRESATRIGDAVRLAASDPTARGIVLAATGDTFVSGGDLNELRDLVGSPGGGSEVAGMIEALGAIETCDLPVVAAVQGDALGGGCELLLLCDLVVIEQHASLAFRQAKMGLSPAWGGVTRLVERVGPLETARLLMTAEKVDAAEALRLGLVNEVVPTGASRARAVARVNRIADNPRSTVATIKRSIREVRLARRGDALARERAIFGEVWGGEEHQRAMSAFAKKT